MRLPKPSPALVFNTVVSAVLLVLLSWEVAAHHTLTLVESNTFRLINELPVSVKPLLLSVMQLGSYVAIFVLAGVVLIFRKRQFALELLIAGNLAYWLAKLCKALVHRPRPSSLIDFVDIRDTVLGHLGYPSGHVAVATALCFVANHYMPTKYRRLFWWGVILVGVARVYVGAHLPVDVVGGFLVGWLAVNSTRLVIGEHNPLGSLSYISRVLTRRCIKVKDLQFVHTDARDSIPLSAVYAKSGERVFIKATGREQRDADLLFKLYRRTVYRNIEDELPYFTAKQKNEHEAYMTLLAERAGVRTPTVLRTIVDDHGNAFLIQRFIEGTPLKAVRPGSLRQRTLTDIWRQLVALHAAGIAHRDMRGSNILLDEAGEAHVIDLSFAEENASPLQKSRDVVELLVTTAQIADVSQAVAAAKRVLGAKTLGGSMQYLQKNMLTRASKKYVNKHSGLLDALREEIIRQCKVPSIKPVRLTRISRRAIVGLIIVGIAVYLLLPQLGEARRAVGYIWHANVLWLSLSLLFSAITYLLSAYIFQSAALGRPAISDTLLLQVASSFVNRFAPGGIGSAAVSVRFLQQQGLPTFAAVTSVGLARVAGVLSTLLLLPFLLLYARNIRFHFWPASKKISILFIAIAAFIVIGAILILPKLRSRVREAAQQAREVLRTFKSSGHAVRLLLSSLGLSFAYAACLHFALLAVGAHPSFLHVLLVYIAGSSIGSAAPTPGGIGAIEAVLVSALVVTGIQTESAIAGVLVYRIFSFWLPIVPGFFALRYLSRHKLI